MNGTPAHAILAIAATLVFCSCVRTAPKEFAFSEVTVGGELHERIDRNFRRLESDVYLPDRVFRNDDWPGDFVGRTILGTVLASQASHRPPQYLREILDSLPEHFNGRGYLGPDWGDVIDEQQLSGHGWLLRGLCEYYELTGDADVLEYIRGIASNLFLPAKGRFATYPIDPALRPSGVGAESGTITQTSDGWRLSSDIGCVFIGMAGLIHANTVLDDPQIAEVIDEMVDRFAQIDLVEIKAQTHASLTAARSLLRLYEQTGRRDCLRLARKVWDTYTEHGMTCNFENFNWFDRTDTWTEPCAIIDSYILSYNLWRFTRRREYRDWAELIYYNAICHTQRHNGGFGCDNCPDEDDPYIRVHANEAWWCCTMRGGEGLARVARSSWLHRGRKLFIPFFRESELKAEGVHLIEHSNYPFSDLVEIEVVSNDGGYNRLELPVLWWSANSLLLVNGKLTSLQGGVLRRRLRPGDKLTITAPNSGYTTVTPQGKCLFKGPLMLSPEDGKPLYHMMDSTVRRGSYSRKAIY